MKQNDGVLTLTVLKKNFEDAKTYFKAIIVKQ